MNTTVLGAADRAVGSGSKWISSNQPIQAGRSNSRSAGAKPFSQRGKRAIDIAAASVGLLVSAPLLAAAALGTRLCDPGPIFFAHERVGRDGRRFRCLKLRSMVVNGSEVLAAHLNADPAAAAEWAETQKLRHDPRVTRWGRFLRSSSLDELPQLINVLRGDMSLVGPRPVTEGELARYGTRCAAYLSVRPGLTGPWQVSGRSQIGFRRRVAIDTHYAKTWSLPRDLKLILMTVPAVLASRGSY